MALWKASGRKFKLDFRPWHGGRQGGNFEEFDFRSCHCGRQGRGTFIKSQILDSSFKNKSWILDHGIVEGKRSWHCGRQGRKCK